MCAHRLTSQTIDDEAALRALIGLPKTVVTRKIMDRLSSLTRQFVERAPMVCLATSDHEGTCDVSPRGDPAGFVRIIDDQTLLVPERPGNRLADSLRDTFRVNGRATLTTDATLLEPCSVEGKRPLLGILVDIEQAYTHCSKAFLRSDFWNPGRFLAPEDLPSNGQMACAMSGGAIDAETYDAERKERYAKREGFY
jgi:PPOX class probable FMN-dependent enzyme